ncbi:Wzz/FepE/Etk N-terminal domain-containing protein [Pedobacter sp. Du54]|uniref:Wzz/FepE/Etk N-terminal domain-containing protein n=1 Tax=Pedobacter anseongensis TaxID=3133439 RepID=UPI0030A5BAEF
MSSLKGTLLIFSDWATYLKARFKTILLVAIVAALLALVYGYFKKPMYTASTSFVLENGGSEGGGLGQYLGIASMIGIDVGGGGGVFNGDNIFELYKSRQMIQKALLSKLQADSTQLLIDRYLQFTKIKGADVSFKTPSLSRLQDSILSEVVLKINKYNLRVGKPNQRLDVIRVDVSSKDELFAKEFNNQMVKNVNDFYVQTKTKKALANVKILQHKTDSVRAVMNGAISSVAQVNDATPNLNPTRQTQRMAPVQRAQFTAEANKAVLEELLKNLELSKINLNKETPLIQVIDEPVFPLEREKIYLWAYGLGAFLGTLAFMTLILLLRKTVLEKLR